jgi:RNAse (barnase) inhibitor barstar
MTSFREDPSEWQRLDWRLLHNSPIALYYRAEILAEDLAWLRTQGYAVDEFDSSKWDSAAGFHSDVELRLGFPDYYGQNLDAFNDCMRDIEIPNSGGRAIVFHRFDTFAKREPSVAQAVLDIMAKSAWRSLLVGRRLLTLVQSDDPGIMLETVGAHPVIWNPREWLNKDRGL